VAAITEIIAQLIGFNQTDLEDLCWGALLHDVGKIAIDPAIQNKPGKLTDDEYKQIMLHTQIGPDIVRPIVKSDILDIIRCHHFRYDGQGINQMNEGVEIPIGARIVAVADTYDAMTTDRPYRKALPKETAFQEISKCSGTQFDPDITLVFIKARDILGNPENIDNNIKNIIYI
jgi:HD-GYP domain-containing protein (c-di-GMP phosphodiesterase class II)